MADLKAHLRNISIETNLGGDIIGRKYLKSDEVGTPFALVVDDQSVDSRTVTIRDRDTLQQKRIPQEDIPGKIMRNEINVRKSRIQHTMTLKSNYEFLDRFKIE